ncbi:MAG: type II toxin-antitoxin system RelE/ParE family toxin [Verrucomicrobia bacterium]|nr:type II toxin-antitoxin system RelE/ParE family toxin [Verrucomicrobiota bacterium]
MKLVLTEAALDDLRSIRAHTLERWGKQQEARYLNRLWARFETIRADPARSRPRQDLFPGCRIAPEGSHVILFRNSQETLEIVRVLHAAMDCKRHLAPGEPL